MTTVVTELVVDARGTKQGTAEYISAMNAAQAAVDRTLERERTLQTAMTTGGTVMQSSATSVARAAREMERLKASIDPAYHSAKALERDIVTLDRAVTRLGVSEGDAARMLEAVRLKHDAVAAAAKRQTEEYLKLAAAGRAAYAADMSQAQVNQQIGVVDVQPGSARASAAVFEQSAKETDQMAAAAQRLRAELDPVAAAQDRYNAELVEYDAMAKRGVITSGELANAQARAKQRLEETTARARAGGAGINSFSDALRNASTQASLFHGPLGGIASRMTALNSLLSSGGVAAGLFTLALGASVYMVGSAVRAHEAYERSGRRIDAVTRATAGAVGMQSKEIRDFTRDLALNTLASVEESEQAAAKLLTFRSVQQDTFKRTLAAAQDLAEAGFGSLESAAVQLGKALENPAEGLSALTRVGVSFSGAQKQLIRDLMETGRIAEAQRVILEGVERQVGGTGRNAAQGLSGALDTLSQRWGENKVALEDWLGSSPALIGIVNRLAGELDRLNKSLSPDRFGNPIADRASELERLRTLVDDIQKRANLSDDRLSSAQGPSSGETSTDPLFPYQQMGLESQIAPYLQRIRDLESEISNELEKQFFLRQLNNRQAREAREEAERERGLESYEKRRRDLEATIDLARVDLDLVGRSVAETERRRMVETVLIEARQRGGQAAVDALSKEIEITRDGIKLKTTELDLLKERAAEYGRIRATQSARDTISGQGDELEMMRLERDLIGGSTLARERAIAALRTEQEIRRLGIDIYSKEAKELRQNTALLSAHAEALARANLLQDLQFERSQLGRNPIDRQVAQRLRGSGLDVDLSSYEAGLIRTNILLERQRDIWEDIQGVGMDAIDKIVDSGLNGFKDLGDVAKDIAGDILKEFTTLALKNPLKNMIFDANLPTLDGIGGIGGFFSALLGGKAPAVQSVAAMQVQAAVVNINGGLGGDVARLLNPANSNLPGQVTRAPLPNITGAAPGSFRSAQEAGLTGLVQAGGRHPFLDLIAKAEGTAGPNGYNTSLGYGRFTGGEKNLTGMTLDEVAALQKQMLAHPDNHFNSSALGRYQIVGKTMRGLRGQMGLKGDELFDERMQDTMAMRLAQQRGPNVAGLRNEWEGLRNVGGDKILETFKQTEKAVQDFATKTAETAINVGDLGTTAIDATGGLGDLAGSLMKGIGGEGGGGILKLLMGLFGFEEGGFTGHGPSNKPAGVVHAGEYVVRASEVSKPGVRPLLEAINSGARGYSEGGYVNAAPTPSYQMPQQRDATPTPVILKQELAIVDRVGVNFRQEEEDDGAGGKRPVLVVEERIAAGFTRRGSAARGALESTYGLRPKRRRFG